MISIEVKLLGVFRGLSGKNKVSMQLEEPATVGVVIQKIAEGFSSEFRRVLIDFELGDPRPNALILVNGIEINAIQGLETDVNDGDEIVLVPVSHGG